MDINQFRKYLHSKSPKSLTEAADYTVVAADPVPQDPAYPNAGQIVVLLTWKDGFHAAGVGHTKDQAIQNAIEYRNHTVKLKQRLGIHEGIARKAHSDGNFHTLKTPGNRTLVFSDNEMVGHIDLLLGTPDVIANSADQHVVYINGSYRDSRLKMQRPVFRKVGTFSSYPAALEGLRAALANLRK